MPNAAGRQKIAARLGGALLAAHTLSQAVEPPVAANLPPPLPPVPASLSVASNSPAAVPVEMRDLQAQMRQLADQVAALRMELGDARDGTRNGRPLSTSEQITEELKKSMKDRALEIGLGLVVTAAAIFGYLRNKKRFQFSGQFNDLSAPLRPVTAKETHGRHAFDPPIAAEEERFGPRTVVPDGPIDGLLGGPTTGLHGLLFRVFSPRASAFLRAQRRAEKDKNLAFLRMRNPWGETAKVASVGSSEFLGHDLVTTYLERSFLHLCQEIHRLDPQVNITQEMFPDGAFRLYGTFTFEAYDEVKNRFIISSGLAVCAQLANPTRWIDGALRRAADHQPSELKRVVRQMEIDLGLALNVASLLDLHLPEDAVNTRAAIERNRAGLTAMLLLSPDPSLKYLSEYTLNEETIGNVIPLPAEQRAALSAAKRRIIAEFSQGGAAVAGHAPGSEQCHTNLSPNATIVLTAAERARIHELWFHGPNRMDLAAAACFDVIGKMPLGRLSQRARALAPVLRQKERHYFWFRSFDR